MGDYRHGSIENLNWYPGHMKKTGELISKNLKLVDAVIETIDARIPVSSRNPVIDELIGGKSRIIVLNKSDLADPAENTKWVDRIKKDGYRAILTDCSRGAGKDSLMKALEGLQEERNRKKSLKRKLRLIIVGVPNVGKSSLINRLTGRRSTQTGNRPGVTKGKQWLTLENGMQLLDTPGILWPKFEDAKVGLNLAFCGSIKDEVLDTDTLGLELIKLLLADHREMLTARYKIELDDLTEGSDKANGVIDAENMQETALSVMERIALKRGFVFQGRRIDYTRTANTVLDEFRSGKTGRITIERV